MTEQVETALLAIGRARERGLSQVQIAQECQFSAKDCFRFIRPLVDMELVAKMPYLESKKNTNILFHRCFLRSSKKYCDMISTIQNLESLSASSIASFEEADPERVDIGTRVNYDLMKRKILTLLSSAQNSTLLMSDLILIVKMEASKRLRKSFYRVIHDLTAENCIECIKILALNESGTTFKRCVRFLQNLQVRKNQETIPAALPKIREMYAMNIPLEVQIQNVVRAYGADGCTVKEILLALNNCGYQIVNKALLRLTTVKVTIDNGHELKSSKQALLKVVSEFVGRNRHYRYYSAKQENGNGKLGTPKIAQPTSADLDVPSTSEDTTPVISGRSNFQSINAVERRSKLLAMLEIERCLPLGTALAAKLQEAVGPTGSQICRKTLARDAEALHQDSQAILYTKAFNRITGGAVYVKSFLIHRSLSPQSPEVKEFFERARNETFQQFKGTKSLEVVDMEVQSVVKSNRHAIRVQPSPKIEPIETFRNAQVSYGYVAGKLVRLKLLHEWIVSELFAGSANDQSTSIGHDKPFRTYTLFDNIPLQLYLKVIGKKAQDDELDAYISTNGLDMRVCDMLPKIRAVLFSDWRIRSLMLKYLEMMIRLGLLRPDNENDWAAGKMCSSFIATYHAPLYDFESTPLKVIKTVELNDVAAVQEYWNACEYQCILRRTSDATPPPEELAFLFHPANWSWTAPLSFAERQSLDAFVHSRLEFPTPFRNLGMCSQISEETGLDLNRVRAYYRNVEAKVLKSRASIVQNKSPQNITVSGVSKKTRFDARLIEKLQHANVVQQPLPPDDPVTRRRMYWTTEQDNILQIGQGIASHYRMANRLPWKKLSALLPGRDSRRFQTRAKALATNIEIYSLYLKVERAWPSIFQDICRKEGIDPSSVNHDNLQNHIVQFAEFVKLKLSDYAAVASDIGDGTIDEAMTMYDLSTLRKDYIVDIANQKIDFIGQLNLAGSINARSSLFQSASLICHDKRALADFSNPVPFDRETIDREKLRSLIKMLLVTPDDTQDPAQAFFILKQYPSALVNQVYYDMQKENIIVRRGKRVERLPGRTMQFSEMFAQVMKGPLAERIIPEALIYLESIQNLESYSNNAMPLEQTSGMMLVFAEGLARKTITFSPEIGLEKSQTSFHEGLVSFNSRISFRRYSC